MGLFDKLKNVFTEEVEEEPIKKEVRQVEIKGPTTVENEVVEEKKEEKFVFPVYFDDKDFDELKPKEPPKKEVPKKEVPKKETYGIKNKEVKVEKKFTPSPVISPVYGVLDKNYNKEDIKTRKVTRTEYRSSTNVTLDDIRKKAYGSLEDDLANSLFADDPIYVEKEEIYIETTPTEMVEEKIINDYKPEPIEELDQNMTLEELNKLDELNNLKDKEDEELKMNESDLFNLIDSMYENGDENDNN